MRLKGALRALLAACCLSSVHVALCELHNEPRQRNSDASRQILSPAGPRRLGVVPETSPVGQATGRSNDVSPEADYQDKQHSRSPSTWTTRQETSLDSRGWNPFSSPKQKPKKKKTPPPQSSSRRKKKPARPSSGEVDDKQPPRRKKTQVAGETSSEKRKKKKKKRPGPAQEGPTKVVGKNEIKLSETASLQGHTRASVVLFGLVAVSRGGRKTRRMLWAWKYPAKGQNPRYDGHDNDMLKVMGSLRPRLEESVAWTLEHAERAGLVVLVGAPRDQVAHDPQYAWVASNQRDVFKDFVGWVDEWRPRGCEAWYRVMATSANEARYARLVLQGPRSSEVAEKRIRMKKWEASVDDFTSFDRYVDAWEHLGEGQVMDQDAMGMDTGEYF